MHFFAFNIKSYAHATVHLTNEEDLAYRRILDICYDTEAPLDPDPKVISRRVRCELTSVQNVLGEYFILTDTGWVHPRVQKELDSTYAKSEKAKESALLSVKARQDRANAQRTLNERSTNVELPITHDPVPMTQKEKTKKSQQAAPVVFPFELDTQEFKQAWEEYMTYRRQSKFKTLKSASIHAKFQEMAEWGHDQAVEALKASISNGWQGIFQPTGKPTPHAATTSSKYDHAF